MRAWNVILPWYEARGRVDLDGFAFVPRARVAGEIDQRMGEVAANFDDNSDREIGTYTGIAMITDVGPSWAVPDGMMPRLELARIVFCFSQLSSINPDGAHAHVVGTISYFIEGDRDTYSAGIDTRLALMATAFERQARVTENQAKELANWLGRRFPGLGTVPLSASRRASASKGRSDKEWLHQRWLHYLYLRCNSSMHPHAKAGQIWSDREHLLAACAIFPLAVKAELAGLRLDDLSHFDRAHIMQVDRLLDEPSWHTTGAGIWHGDQWCVDAWLLSNHSATSGAAE